MTRKPPPSSPRARQDYVQAFYSPKDTKGWKVERLFNKTDGAESISDYESEEVFITPDGTRYVRAFGNRRVDAVVFFAWTHDSMQLRRL